MLESSKSCIYSFMFLCKIQVHHYCNFLLQLYSWWMEVTKYGYGKDGGQTKPLKGRILVPLDQLCFASTLLGVQLYKLH